jgi:hypothetical protein
MRIDEEKLAEIIDDALEEIGVTLGPMLRRIDEQHGEGMAVNVALNIGADILANSLAHIKSSELREAALIGHATIIAKNMEIVLAENTTDMLIGKIKKAIKK